MLDVQRISAGGRGGTSLLKHLNLKIGNGEIVAVVGRNGSGKTTLLRSIMGLERITTGEIWVNETRLDQLQAYKVARQGVGYAAQQHGLFSDLTIEENLRVGHKNTSRLMIPEPIKTRFSVIFHKAAQKARTLSGGEKQQVKLLRAIARAQKLLLLDEIARGVNEDLFPNFVSSIREVAAQRNIPTLLVEQRHNFAESFADRTYELVDGRLQLS